MSFEDEDRPNCCVVLDDCIALDQLRKPNNAVQRLASNYRHVLGGADGGGALIFSSQKLTSFPPTIRRCCNTVIIGKTGNIGQRKQMVDEFGDAFGGPDQFEDMLLIW